MSVGLSGETISGTTEETDEHPRPCVRFRLDSTLVKIQPDVVVACYGMNDGNYSPLDEDRFKAYKEGINILMDTVLGQGKKLVILTPPPFDPLPQKDKLVEKRPFGYPSKYYEYHKVLETYAAWLNTLERENIIVVDLNTYMTKYLHQQREINPDYTFSKDGVHPDGPGHLLMARAFLHKVNVPVDTVDVQIAMKTIEQDTLYKLIQERRIMLADSWRNEIGHNHQNQWKGLPIEVALARADSLSKELKTVMLK